MNAQLLDRLTQAATYRELQAALKSAIAQGYKIHCKLNAKKEDLIVAVVTQPGRARSDSLLRL